MSMHRPLRKRANILSHDVADAIEQLIGQQLSLLPQAYTKQQIIDQLIIIAHTEEDGTVGEITPISRRTMTDQFYNRLTNTAIFQAGYKRYEERSRLPVVPVTDFFFRIVCGNGDDCVTALDAMTDLELRQSLPKRSSAGRKSEDMEGNIEYHRDESGLILVFGELAGIVVIPADAQSNLLRAWLRRLSHVSTGNIQRTVERIEHARPDNTATTQLQEQVRPLSGAMSRALPRPKRR